MTSAPTSSPPSPPASPPAATTTSTAPSTDSLRGRVALVTGAAKSLGADIVRRLAGSGAHVIVNYFHSVEQAESLRTELEEAGHSCEFIRASVAKTSEIDRMFDLIQERHGGLDFLINNAAGGAFLPLFDVDDTYWQRAWSTNVMGAYHCSRRAAELMAGRRGASILCLSSVGARQPVQGYGPGGVTKAALESLVRYLALELVGEGIRVNTVLLGSVVSEILVNLDGPAAVPGGPAENSELMSRTLSTPEAARLIVHLLHEDTAFITGQTVVADGGISIGGMQGLRLHSRLADRVTVPARRRPVPAASVTAPPAVTTPPVVDLPAPEPPAAAYAAPGPAPMSAPASAPTPAPAAAPVTVTSPEPEPDRAPEHDPGAVAVVGLGLALPGANNTAEFWDRLREGALISSEPSAFDLKHFWAPTREDTDAFYVREAGYLHDFVPDPASLTEPDGNAGHPGWPRTTRWLRHCAVQALAGVRTRPADRWLAATTGIHDQTGLGPQGVVLGDEYRRMVREAIPAGGDGEWLAELADHAIGAHYGGDGGNPRDYLPASVSRNALRGLIPAEAQHLTLDAACASGLFALDAAVKALREGSCDVALVGGTSIIEPIGFTLFCRAQGISMSGRIRPFDRAADGTIIGEGAVTLALKSYARAVADGDRILGVVRGTGLAADGRGKGIHAPATRGQELAISRAWADAGVEADDVDWVVAHGTGTPVGDEIELRSLLSRLGPRRRACLLTSNKQVFGHTGVLAGLVSVAHALVALDRGAVPGQPVVTDPHPLLEDGARLTVPVEDVPWPADDARPRVVGVSSFGLGGADAHVVLSDRVPAAAPVRRQGGDAAAGTEDLVVVGWNTHLPGLDRARVPAWLRGDGPFPEAGFGTPYPLPSPREVRIPPLTMRHMDAAHLMVLQALRPLLDDLGEAGTGLRPTTAVMVGATLPTTHNTRAALRVHAAECASAFDLLPDPAQAEKLREYLAKGMAASEGVIPGGLNEDDFTGAVSCILSGRAANYYDFRGMGTSLYAQRDSAHTAVDLALRQLRHRACDLALVGAVCLRPISGWDRHLAGLVPEGRTIAEGAAVLAVTRLSTALEHHLPVLGTLSTALDGAGAGAGSGSGSGDAGAPAHSLPVLAGAGHTYLSLDALLTVVRAVVTGTDTVVTPAAPGSPPIRFTRPTVPPHRGQDREEAEPLRNGSGDLAADRKTEPGDLTPDRPAPEQSDPDRPVAERGDPTPTAPKHSASDRTVAQRPGPDGTVAEGRAPARTVAQRPDPARTVPERGDPTPTAPERGAPDRTLAQRGTADLAVAEGCVPDRTAAQRPGPNRPVAERGDPDPTAPERGAPDLTRAQRGSPDRTLAEGCAPDRTAAQRPDPARTVAERGDPDPAAPERGAPDLAGAQRGAPDRTVAGHSAPDRAAPDPSGTFAGRRQTFRLVPVPAPPPRGGPAAPSLSPGTVVLTDVPDLAAAVTGRDVAVWSPRPGCTAATHVPAEEAPRALAGLPFVPRHIRVLSRLPAPGSGSDDADALRMEELQDLTFTTLQAALPALRSGGSLGGVLLGELPDDLPPPLSGLFSGLVRSVRAEVPQCGGVLLLTDAPDAATALEQLARAGAAEAPAHTLACRGGAWSTLAVADDDTAPPPERNAPLPPGAVVVAFGGARGITPELLQALARTTDRPHLYVVGRTPPAESGDALPPQAAFIAAERRERPGASVGELRATYEKAQARLEVRRTVERLTELCGPDRVHHRVCDVLDADGTAAVVHEVLDRHGQIDLLVNTVLDLRSRALHAKTLADFRAVRATKAAGYRNLKRALAGRPPRIWCNFSTLATLAPAPGDPDYCAVNEYLAYASAWAQRHGPDGHQEFAILWSGWREVGVASSATMRETLERNRMDAYISTAQGRAQFLSALARPPAGGVVFFIREEERVLLARRGISTYGSTAEPPVPAPDAPPPAPPDPALTTPLLDGVLHRGDTWAVYTKTWDPRTLAERDGRWMRHHRVNGEYTLPGTFVLEAAAAAAAPLCPGLVVTGFRGLVCRTSVTVRLAGPPRTVAVEARVTSRGRDRAEVAVRMTAHRLGRNGKVLRFDDLLCETTVVLADRFRTLPRPPDSSSYEPEPDFAMPVYSPDPPISLTGPFAGTRDYALGPDGSSAGFALDHAAWAPALAGMTVPALLLDAMAQLLLLPPRGERPPPFGPMAGLDEVDLGGPGDDCRLSAENPVIRLHHDFATGALTAVTGDGRVLARITGVGAHAPDHSGEVLRPGARVPRSPLL
ncbi:SDR family oxidoreductase [Streptomyces sp. NPDC006638]|uniref:SDR family oxidoreductase n=1 Tax=Streptomyces sp. NPDC006638 TaxID=3157183 RepID=UPI0033A891AE